MDFLQKELSSKEAIINMLVNDKCATNANNNKPESINKNKTEPLVNKNMTCNYEQSLSKRSVISNMHRKYYNDNESDFEPVNHRKKSTNQRSLSIIGDSILKEIDPYIPNEEKN